MKGQAAWRREDFLIVRGAQVGKWASWRRAKQPEEPTIWGCGRCQGSPGVAYWVLKPDSRSILVNIGKCM